MKKHEEKQLYYQKRKPVIWCFSLTFVMYKMRLFFLMRSFFVIFVLICRLIQNDSTTNSHHRPKKFRQTLLPPCHTLFDFNVMFLKTEFVQLRIYNKHCVLRRNIKFSFIWAICGHINKDLQHRTNKYGLLFIGSN